MDKIIFITPTFAVTGELTEADLLEARARGFKSIVSNRPDGEVGAPLTARAEAVAAWRAGLQFHHVPATKHDLFANDVVEGMEAALRALEGPILAHCKSGQRSAIVWAAASARSQPVGCVLDTLKAAGFDLDVLRDDLEQQAHRRRWTGTPEALDCNCDVGTDAPNVVSLSPQAA